MKTFNKIISSLFALGLLVGFAACTEEIPYESALKPTNAQVFFPSTLPSKINLSVDFSITSFNIQLYRADVTSDLTVNLIVENGAPDIFTFPTSVSFAAGSEVTQFTVNYDPGKLDFDDYKSFSITISDESITTPYGTAVYAFTAGFPAPWGNVGKVIVKESSFQEEAVVVIQRFANQNRYRLVGIYSAVWEAMDPTDPDIPYGLDKTLEFYLDDDANAVGIPEGYQDLGYGLYGNEFFWALPGQPYAQYMSFTNEANFYRITAIRANNRTSLYTCWIEFEWIEGYPGIIPEKFDYTAEIKYLGRLTDKDGVDNAMAVVTLGEDVANAQVAVVKGSALTNAILNGIIGGTIESTEIEESGNVLIPCAESGM